MASRLVAPRCRALMVAFYDFARAADDVADDPRLDPAAKLARLDMFAAGLDRRPGGAAEGHRLADALAASGRSGAAEHARALLGAFRQDATTARYESWEELLAYCRMSADPVGRFVLEIHDEPPETTAPSDALCTVLQILNHLQDLRDDARALDRVYLPQRMLRAAGASDADVGQGAATPALRAAIDAVLVEVDALLGRADALPRRLRSRRLTGEVRAILVLAHRLRRRLGTADPLAGRVSPGRIDMARAGIAGIVALAAPRPRRTASAPAGAA